ncbi:MAG: Gfo/Idh/MocA family protein [Anaerolineae bacterium]
MTRYETRVGVVGCGVVASAYYLPWLMEHANLAAVCDANPRRAAACQRLFAAREQYTDYAALLEHADIEAVFILTGPGTHSRFAIMAAEAGKHLLLQKPMATTFNDAQAVARAVRRAGVAALIEPSQNSPLEPGYRELRELVRRGALGDPYWFNLLASPPTRYHPSLAGNPYGAGAFYNKDSGGMLFDFPYGPSQIVSLLGACKSVSAVSRISTPQRYIVPESDYDDFLEQATDPQNANYWDAVVSTPRTQLITVAADDSVGCLYEMRSGAQGAFYAGRAFHPTLPGTSFGGLEILGTEGNLVMGAGHFGSIISSRRDLLPEISEDGWYHLPLAGDVTRAAWPKPLPGGFNYYHASSHELLEAIRTKREPFPGLEWGLHITEMMTGAVESWQTGCRYELRTSLDW